MIITKAGPGTIMEALICGLPLVLNAFVPCQEEGNIPFVVENKVGGAGGRAGGRLGARRWLEGGGRTSRGGQRPSQWLRTRWLRR